MNYLLFSNSFIVLHAMICVNLITKNENSDKIKTIEPFDLK